MTTLGSTFLSQPSFGTELVASWWQGVKPERIVQAEGCSPILFTLQSP